MLTRPGALPRSWARSIKSAAATTDRGSRSSNGHPHRQGRLRCRRRHQDQLPDDRTWRLLPGSGQLHRGRDPLCALTPSGAGTPVSSVPASSSASASSRTAFTATPALPAPVRTSRMPAGDLQRRQSTHHGLGRQRRLRALLDSGPAYVAGRRIQPYRLRQGSHPYVRAFTTTGTPWVPPHRAIRLALTRRLPLAQLRHRVLRLELLQHLFPYPVEHHEGLLRRSGRLRRPHQHDVEGPDDRLSGRMPARDSRLASAPLRTRTCSCTACASIATSFLNEVASDQLADLKKKPPAGNRRGFFIEMRGVRRSVRADRVQAGGIGLLQNSVHIAR